MDPRLVPINGLIALLRGEGGWPGRLGEQGFKRDRFEVPITTEFGEIVADGLLYRESPAVVLLAEAKSGRNIEEKQARKYVAADLQGLRRVGVLPPSLRSSEDVTVGVLFVGMEEHRADLENGLRHLDISAPLLTIGPDRVRLSGASSTPGLDDFDLRHRGGLPPARLPVDQHSTEDQLTELLLPELIAAQARKEDVLALEAVAGRLIPEWPVLAHGMRQQVLGRLIRSVQSLASNEMRGEFRFEPITASDTRGRIVIERTPADRDPRGRTQAWQAQRGRAEKALNRRAAKPSPDQLSLDQLADEGGLANS